MKYNAIFIQIPRTGCGSINSILNQTGGHREASWWKKHTDEWDKRFKFAVVRNPYDRFVSLCSHFGLSVLEGLKSEEWAFKPQTFFIDEKLDYIARFENLEEEWGKISQKLGIEQKLPIYNKSSSKIALSETEKRLVYSYYLEDFETFYIAEQ